MLINKLAFQPGSESNPSIWSTTDLKPPGMDGAPAERFDFSTPYGPHIGEDGIDHDFAPGVLHTVWAGWETMRRAAPGLYEGLTITGSFVKGRARVRSDVDAYVFCDPNAAPNVDAQAAEDIRTHIGGRLQAANYPDLVVRTTHYVVVDINEAIVNKAVASLVAGAGSGDSFAHSIPGMDTILPLFYMRLGSGKVLDYRQQFIDRLSASSVGEKVWAQLADTLASKEEYRRRAKIDLPQTLAEAAIRLT